MTSKHIYFDHNATSPLGASARAAMIEALEEGGNASSIHASGRRARARIEAARGDVARLAGANPGDVTFTSGGTEANNLVISSALAREGALIISCIEHPSVLEAAAMSGREVKLIPCGPDGVICPAALQSLLDEEETAPALVSVMLANNETGVIQPIAELAEMAHAKGALIHTDAAQAGGRIEINSTSLGADYLTMSAHKMGGPQGVGAVITSCGAALTPALIGGGQERKMRPGTENQAGIAGFGAAARHANETLKDMNRIKGLRDELESRIQVLDAKIQVLGGSAPRLPNTSLLTRTGFPAETIVMALDIDGAAVSAGAACSSGKSGASHVPAAMGLDEITARSAFRISLGPETDIEDVERFVNILAPILQRMTDNRSGKLAA